MKGFIRLDRRIAAKLREMPDECCGLYLRLLAAVNWKPKRWKGIEIQPGQMVYARRLLAERLYGCEKPPAYNTIRKRMDELEDHGLIRIEGNPRFTKLTVLNYIGSNFEPNLEPKSEPNSEPDRRRKKKGKKVADSDRNTAEHFYASLVERNPDHRRPNIESWANTIRLMRERDRKTDDQIRDLWDRAQVDDFWQANILCPKTLRKQWDRLTLKFKPSNGKSEIDDIPFYQSKEVRR